MPGIEYVNMRPRCRVTWLLSNKEILVMLTLLSLDEYRIGVAVLFVLLGKFDDRRTVRCCIRIAMLAMLVASFTGSSMREIEYCCGTVSGALRPASIGWCGCLEVL